MFFFKKKKTSVKRLDDSIWLNKAMRYKGLYENAMQFSEKGRVVFIIPFFTESIAEVQFILNKMNLKYIPITQQSEIAELQESSIHTIDLKWLNQTFIKHAASYLHLPITFIFSEHYPISSLEKELLDKLGTFKWLDANCQFFDSLDSELLKMFASKRIKELLERMGISKEENLSHPMITKSIKRAQEKLASGIKREIQAESEEEWFKKNKK